MPPPEKFETIVSGPSDLDDKSQKIKKKHEKEQEDYQPSET
jgi:hypothetical protein